MAVCTRTYTYTSGSDWKANSPLSIPLSSFTVSGEQKKKIAKIISITASWKCKLIDSRESYHYVALQWSDLTLTCDTVFRQKGGNVYSFSSAFSTLPDVSKWVESDITVAVSLTPLKAINNAAWSANASNPVVITLVYEGISFEPWIQNVKMYRADETGAAKDSGENLSFSCTVGVNNTGTDGSGVVTITNGSTTIATIEQIAGSTTGTAVNVIPLSGVTQDSGVDVTYTVTFVYTATQDGSVQTDSISTTVYVGEVFTNVHLTGVKTGGVRFGGYSTATLDNPKFECNYPAYFYGGIAYGGLDYSLDEIDTGVKWIDGKTIYRKVIIIDSPVKGTNQYIDIGASGTIDKLISIRGIGVSSTGAYPMPTIATSDYNIVIFEGSGNPVTQVLFYQGTKRGITWAFGVVEYTLVDTTTT